MTCGLCCFSSLCFDTYSYIDSSDPSFATLCFCQHHFLKLKKLNVHLKWAFMRQLIYLKFKTFNQKACFKNRMKTNKTYSKNCPNWSTNKIRQKLITFELVSWFWPSKQVIYIYICLNFWAYFQIFWLFKNLQFSNIVLEIKKFNYT